MGKIGELFSDEESVKQLTDIARMLMSDSSSGTDDSICDEESSVSAEADSSASSDGVPDIGSLLKLTSLMGAFSQKDKNSELLLALRPHLNEEKQKKVDKAIKMLKLIAVLNIARENGLLNDLL